MKCELINKRGDCSLLDIPCEDVSDSDCKHVFITSKINKAIAGLEFCGQIAGCNKECPYYPLNENGCGTCMATMRKDSLELLKAYKELLKI